jgi:hypothetical protein
MADVLDMLGTEDAALDEVSVEILEQQITSFAGRLAAATATWLVWIGAFDRRLGWQRWDQTSCAGWLNWKCGLDLRTARDHVRVARSLEHLPEVRQLFLAGELSYSKVRAITRVADEFNEHELCELAVAATASQMDRVCSALADTDPPADWSPSVRFESFINHGRIVIECPIDDLHRCRQVVDAGVTTLLDEAHDGAEEGQTRRDTIELLGGRQTVVSGVIVALITGVLDAAEGPFEDALLVADVEALAPVGAREPDCGGECTLGGDAIPPVIARRLACDARLQAAVQDAVGTALGLGREQRVVNRRMRRLLMRRDGGMCRFPGCGVRRGLHAHHVVHWADGGETELENLVMVCNFHHHSLHEGGWNVINKNGRFVFYDPSGSESTVESMAAADGDHTLPAVVPLRKSGSAEPLAGWGERMDLGWVVSAFVTKAELRRERLAKSTG